MSLFGTHTDELAPTTTAAVKDIATPCVMMLLRCPASNNDNVYVNLGDITANSGDMIIQPGESINIDITGILKLKLAMGLELIESDYITKVSYLAASGTQALWVDVFTL